MGKHGQQRKVSEALDEIKMHIESFPAYKSHYTRKDTDQNICLCLFVCVYPSSSLGWRYGINDNSGSCRQPN